MRYTEIHFDSNELMHSRRVGSKFQRIGIFPSIVWILIIHMAIRGNWLFSQKGSVFIRTHFLRLLGNMSRERGIEGIP